MKPATGMIKPLVMNIFGDLVPPHEMYDEDWEKYFERSDWRKVIDAFNELECFEKLVLAEAFHDFHERIKPRVKAMIKEGNKLQYIEPIYTDDELKAQRDRGDSK